MIWMDEIISMTLFFYLDDFSIMNVVWLLSGDLLFLIVNDFLW